MLSKQGSFALGFYSSLSTRTEHHTKRDTGQSIVWAYYSAILLCNAVYDSVKLVIHPGRWTAPCTLHPGRPPRASTRAWTWWFNVLDLRGNGAGVWVESESLRVFVAEYHGYLFGSGWSRDE